MTWFTWQKDPALCPKQGHLVLVVPGTHVFSYNHGFVRSSEKHMCTALNHDISNLGGVQVADPTAGLLLRAFLNMMGRC